MNALNTSEVKNSGFSLTFAETDDKNGLWGRLICSLLLFVGLGGCLWSVMGMTGVGASPLLLFLLGSVGCILSCRLPGKWDFAYIGIILALAVLVAVASRLIIEGGGIAMNQMYAALEHYIGRSFPRFLLSEDANQALCASLFLIIPTELLAVLCGRVAGGGGRYAVIPFIVAIWVLALVFEAALPIVCVLALVIAALSLPTLGFTAMRYSLPNRQAAAWALVLSTALTLISAIPSLIIINTDGSKSAPLRLSTTRKIHSVRYDGENQTLPEGDYSRLSGFVLGDEPALTVVLEDVGKYYLRGFVGEVYTGDGWTSISPNHRAQYAKLFTWLHERGFYAQNQHALLTNALGIDSRDEFVQITNDGVSTAYLYAPYELSSIRADASRIGDENLSAAGLRGEDVYTVTVNGGSISDDELLYFSLLAALERNESRVIEYLTSENGYREFVYDSYLEMADAPRAAIERLMSEVEFPDGRISFLDAKMVVNAYFATFVYSETSEFASAGQDVLTYFLEERGVGNSVDFATAATLMFRYMGIPARYVEGYLVTPDSEIDESGAVILRSKDAYAWAEIYRDGVGFVPFEQEFPAIPPLALLETIPLNDNLNEPPTSPTRADPTPWILISLGIILFLLVFAVLAVRRSIKRSRLNKLFSIDDNAVSIVRMTTYAIQLLSYMGIPRENGSLYNLCTELENKLGMTFGEKYAEVISIQQASLFSGKPIADADRVLASALLYDITAHMKKQSSPIRRLQLRWCQCIL